jgi:hypothetical protein
MGEFLTIFEKPTAEQISHLTAFWESELEDHLGEEHASLGLTTDLEGRLTELTGGGYKFLKSYTSCVPSAMAVVPHWRGVDKKISSVLFLHEETQIKCHLACLREVSESLVKFDKKVQKMVERVKVG